MGRGRSRLRSDDPVALTAAWAALRATVFRRVSGSDRLFRNAQGRVLRAARKTDRGQHRRLARRRVETIKVRLDFGALETSARQAKLASRSLRKACRRRVGLLRRSSPACELRRSRSDASAACRAGVGDCSRPRLRTRPLIWPHRPVRVTNRLPTSHLGRGRFESVGCNRRLRMTAASAKTTRSATSSASLARGSASALRPKSFGRRTLTLAYIIPNARVCGDEAAEATNVGWGLG